MNKITNTRTARERRGGEGWWRNEKDDEGYIPRRGQRWGKF